VKDSSVTPLSIIKATGLYAEFFDLLEQSQNEFGTNNRGSLNHQQNLLCRHVIILYCRYV
jgi:hypothetical protein